MESKRIINLFQIPTIRIPHLPKLENVCFILYSNLENLLKYAPQTCHLERPLLCIEKYTSEDDNLMKFFVSDFTIITLELIIFYINNSLLEFWCESTINFPLKDYVICLDNIPSSDDLQVLDYVTKMKLMGAIIKYDFDETVKYAIITGIEYSNNIEQFVKFYKSRENVLNYTWIDTCYKSMLMKGEGSENAKLHTCKLFHGFNICPFYRLPRPSEELSKCLLELIENGASILNLYDASANAVILEEDDDYFNKLHIAALYEPNVQILTKYWIDSVFENQYLGHCDFIDTI